MTTRYPVHVKKVIAVGTFLLLIIGAGCSSSSNTSGAAKQTEQVNIPETAVQPNPPEQAKLPAALSRSEFIWPLCGRIADNPPQGWTLGDNCPVDRQTAAFDDAPLGTSFGPRLLPRNGDYRYDFHRGLDIPADINTPLFAVAAGEVRKAGAHPSFSDGVIEIRHYDPNSDDCNTLRCVSSFYLHISGHSVQIGDQVTQGQMIGYSGASFTDYEHLHFEIRQAPGSHDRFSNWQRDSQHPFAYLDYQDTDTDNIALSINNVDRSNPMAPIVSVNVRLPRSVEMDLNRVEVEVRQNVANGESILINQSHYEAVGKTPENTPYDVNPPFFDMQLLNRQYSYKDSATFAWEMFKTAGMYQSPFHESLPTSYSPNVHLDNPLPTDARKGDFNGMIIAPAPFSTSSTEDYSLDIVFNKLTGTANVSEMCIRVRAMDALNNVSPWVEDGCD